MPTAADLDEAPTMDAHWVARAQAGAGEGYAELVRRYQQRIFALILRMVGQREEAEEVTQEVFLSAFRRLADFRGEAGFYTWLYRIAVNAALSHRRKQRHRDCERAFADLTEHHGAWGGDRAVWVTEPASSRAPDEAMIAEEERSALERALAALDPGTRALLLLREWEGLGYEELARVFDTREGTIKSRLFRARAELMEYFRMESASRDDRAP